MIQEKEATRRLNTTDALIAWLALKPEPGTCNFYISPTSLSLPAGRSTVVLTI